MQKLLAVLLLLVPFIGLVLLLSANRAGRDGSGARALSARAKVRWGKAAGLLQESHVEGGGGGETTTTENAFVQLGSGGKWEGKETKYLRGIAGYCKPLLLSIL